jgi:hypothetical protein
MATGKYVERNGSFLEVRFLEKTRYIEIAHEPVQWGAIDVQLPDEVKKMVKAEDVDAFLRWVGLSKEYADAAKIVLGDIKTLKTSDDMETHVKTDSREIETLLYALCDRIF